MGQSIAFIDGHSVANTITRVHDNARGATRCVEGQHSLDGNIHGGGIEGLEHDLSHSLTIGLWVQWCLGKEDRMLFRCHTKLVVEGVVPNLLHIIPVGDNSMLDWVLQGEDTTLALRLITDIA